MLQHPFKSLLDDASINRFHRQMISHNIYISHFFLSHQ